MARSRNQDLLLVTSDPRRQYYFSLVKVTQPAEVARLVSKFLQDCFVEGEQIVVEERHTQEGAAVGRWYGLWIDYFWPVAASAVGTGVASLFYRLLRQLRKSKQRPVLALQGAVLAARAALETELGSGYRMIRAIRLVDQLDGADYRIIPQAYRVTFKRGVSLVDVIVGSDGTIAAISTRRARRQQ